MNELKTIEVKSKELAQTIKVISDLTQKANANAWGVACQYNDIVSKKLWSDDFKTLDDLATLLSTNKSTISKYSRAYAIAKEHNLLNVTSTGVVACLVSLNKEQIEIAIEQIDTTTTVKQAREIAKGLKALEKSDVDGEGDGESNGETEDVKEPTSDITVHDIYVGDALQIDNKLICITNDIYNKLLQL